MPVTTPLGLETQRLLKKLVLLEGSVRANEL
jgi:hypothetical protein